MSSLDETYQNELDRLEAAYKLAKTVEALELPEQVHVPTDVYQYTYGSFVARLRLDHNSPWLTRARIIWQARKALGIKTLRREVYETGKYVQFQGWTEALMPDCSIFVTLVAEGEYAEAALPPDCTLVAEEVEETKRVVRYKTVCR